MHTKTLRATLIVIAVLALATLACGQSSTEKLADAAKTRLTPQRAQDQPAVQTTPTATSEEKTTEKSQPTATPEEKAVEKTEPTATPTPKSSPTPEPEDLTITDYGFGQDERELGFAFIISNPNPGLAFEDTQYQVAAYDAAGTVLETDSGYVSLILPGQELGIAGTIFLDEGVTVDKIEAQLSLGDAESSDPCPPLLVDNIIYLPDDMFSRVAGVITNPYNVPIQDLRVSAILRDRDRQIIGGGYGYLNFILANGTTGFDVSVASAGDVATAEFHPTLSAYPNSLSVMNAPTTPKTSPCPNTDLARATGKPAMGFSSKIPMPTMPSNVPNTTSLPTPPTALYSPLKKATSTSFFLARLLA